MWTDAGALHWRSGLTAERGVHSSKYKKRAPVAHVTYLLAVQKKLEEKITLLSMDVHPWCVIYGGACSTCISNTRLLTRALGSQGDCSHLVSENTYVALKNMDISHVSGVTVHNRLREYKSVT